MAIIGFLSQELGMDSEKIRKYIASSPHRYKVYRIPKRNGRGYRTIAQPAKELKYLQRIVLHKFLAKMPIHDSALAYRENRGIRMNAKRHTKSSYVLKMDFKDFFPSITPDDLIAHIKEHQIMSLTQEDELVISRLLFYSKNRSLKLKLSIGAPTSPAISNSILYNFDTYISKLSSENGIIYTRYADDITMSSNEKGVLFAYPQLVKKFLNELDYPSLKINQSKTVFLSKKDNRHITGLVLTNDGRTSIGRKKKRYIKGLVYKYKNNLLDEKLIKYLRGYLSFCKDVEPKFIARLEKKYGSRTLKQIRST